LFDSKKSFIMIFAVAICLTLVFAQAAVVNSSEVTEEMQYEVPEMLFESEMLQEKVEKGEILPVEERVPVEPLVVGPGTLVKEEYVDWEVGETGGTLRLAALEAISHEIPITSGINFLRGVGQSTDSPALFLLEEFDYSEDYTTFTMTFKEGLKWSDGEPVTTEDVRFLIEDIYQHEEVPALMPDILYTQGDTLQEPLELNIVDERTFEVSFAEPYGFFITELASWITGYTPLVQPSHYLKQYHADYTPEEEIEPALEEYGYDEWYEVLDLKSIVHWEFNQHYAVGVPVLAPFKSVHIGTDAWEYERNPYFPMIDKEGNQLPYIDNVRVTVIGDMESLNMRVIAGEVDILTQDATLNDMPLYRANEEQGDYETRITGSINAPHALFLNHDYEYDIEDSAWQELVRDEDRKFARALAYAMDSVDINESLYFGRFDLPDLNPAEHDPEKARQLLDEAGMDEFDGEGYRLGPDGEQFVLPLTPYPGMADIINIAELLKEHFEEVGIRTDIDVMGLDIFYERKDGNELQTTLQWNDRPIWPSGMSVDYMPNFKGPWAPECQNYYFTGGDLGRQPPEDIQEFFDIHTARKKYPAESEEGMELYQQLEDWFSENLVMIYPLSGLETPNIVTNRMGNVHKEGATHDNDIQYSLPQIFIKQ